MINISRSCHVHNAENRAPFCRSCFLRFLECMNFPLVPQQNLYLLITGRKNCSFLQLGTEHDACKRLQWQTRRKNHSWKFTFSNYIVGMCRTVCECVWPASETKTKIPHTSCTHSSPTFLSPPSKVRKIAWESERKFCNFIYWKTHHLKLKTATSCFKAYKMLNEAAVAQWSWSVSKDSVMILVELPFD